MDSASLFEKIQQKFNIEMTTFREQISLEIVKENVKELLAYLLQQGYTVLIDLTGVDYLKPEEGVMVFYHLHSPTTYERLRVKTFVAREASLPSVCDHWEAANWYERELYDLFGVKILDHPEIKRILMPDDWVGHPLRKNYALGEEAVAFKHGVEPKVPSEIIPCSKRRGERFTMSHDLP